MFDRFRDRAARAFTPPPPDFEVIGLDPDDWPGGVVMALLPGPEGTCRGVVMRYDLLGGSAPVYALVHERPPAEAEPVPAAVALLLAAAGMEDVPAVMAEEPDLATVVDEPVVVTRLAYEDPQLSYLSFGRPDGTSIGIAGWRKPVNSELLALLRPLAIPGAGGAPSGSPGEGPESSDGAS